MKNRTLGLVILGLSVLQGKKKKNVPTEMTSREKAFIFKVKGRRFLLNFLLTCFFVLLFI